MRTCVSVIAVLFVFLSGPVLAQTETGRVTGTVMEAQGVVPGVKVTLTAVNTGTVRSTVTDQEGKYVLPNIQPAAYLMRFEKSGFKAVNARIQVSVGTQVSFDARLEAGGVSEVVTVSATSDIININVGNAEVTTIVTERQLRDLPLLTRDPYSLVKLAGNVQDQPVEQTDGGATRGPGFNINGARASANNVLLDGSANNDEFDTRVGQDVPLDSVQEFSVVTNNFSAQYGRSAGGIVNVVTKSGGNTYHGTGYEFFRNDAFAANTPDNIANKVEKGQFNRSQIGYSLGGPIAKGKVHFFSSLEYIRVRSFDTQFSWVPTPEFLAASSPATQAYFTAYDKGVTINGPTLTRADVSTLIGGGSGAFSQLPASLPVFGRVDRSLPIDAGGGDPQNDYQFVGRVDFSMGPTDQAYVRYAVQHKTAFEGTNSSSPYPGYDTGYFNKNHSILGSLTHVFSAEMTSQTKLVFNRLLNEQPTNGDPSPRLMMNPNGPITLQGYRIAFPGYLPWDPGNDIPFGGPQSLLQLYHDQTWLRGAHDVRFGGAFVHIADNRTFSAYSNAVEFLNTTSTASTSLDNFVAGEIVRFQAAINPQGYPGGTFTTPVAQPSFTSHNRYDEFALYAQDNWRVRPNLTLNLGLRNEYYGPQAKTDPKRDANFYYGNSDLDLNTASPAEIIDAVRTGTVLDSDKSPTGTLWKKDWNNVAPRIGFAWNATGDGRTSVRGGYGIGYERNFGNVTFNVLFNPPLYLVSTIDSPTDVPSQPIYVDNAGPFGGVAGVTKTIPAGSLRHVDQNIVTAFTHQYGLSVQREVRPGLTAAVEYNGSSGRNLYDLADINKRGAPLVYEGVGTESTRPNPQYGAFNTRGNRGVSQYHGVTFSLDTRALASTGLALTSKFTVSQTKDNLSTTFSDGNNGFFNLGYLDPFHPKLDYGYAEFDVRQRLLVSALWDVPFLRDNTTLKGTLLGGWSVNWIFTARSGYPFTVYDCTNGLDTCIRAIDNVNIDKNATGGAPTGNPNEYSLLDLTPILPDAGSYVNPVTGTSDFGPFPEGMTARDAFRGPGAWFLDLSLSKRFRLAGGQAVQIRVETYNLLNHANMYVRTESADVSSVSEITGYKDGSRRLQLGFKFEF